MHSDIRSGKLQVSLDNVYILPVESNSFDRVFHTNCYYFWDNMPLACAELYRCMKPNSMMVTCLNLDRIIQLTKDGHFKNDNPSPVYYMNVLHLTGFKHIQIKYFKCQDTHRDFCAIFAHIHEKDEDEKLRKTAIEPLNAEEQSKDSEVL